MNAILGFTTMVHDGYKVPVQCRVVRSKLLQNPRSVHAQTRYHPELRPREEVAS